MAIDIWYMNNDKYSRLSNLAERRFVGATGTPYYSVEHGYQSYKTGKFDKATYNKFTSFGMKIRGGPALTENEYNIKLMLALIKASFDQNPADAEFLVSTYPEILTHDRDRSIWRKEFPRMLTMIREYYYYV